jgi:hypothetical protein
MSVELARRPEDINQCDCSVCLRIGAAWGYFHPDEVALAGATTGLARADLANPVIAFHHCGQCGSATHWAALDSGPADRMAVNMRLFDPDQLDGLNVRFSDGFRRKEGGPRLPERHPRVTIRDHWPT